MLIVGCNNGNRGESVQVGPGRSEETRPTAVRPAGPTSERPCEVGERPDYFVPGGEGGPFAIIGCAELGVSGKPVEFSADFERIGRDDFVCIDPAYRGRGQMGIYIPTTCVRDPVSKRLDVVDAGIPSQAVSGYRLVIWGTADSATRKVVAHYEGGKATAAVFTLDRVLASSAGATRPFGVFVLELHPEAACQRIRVRAAAETLRSSTPIDPRPKICSAR